MDYVMGIAKELDMSEAEARQLEQQLWSKASSITDYKNMLRERLQERKQFVMQSQQQQMYAPGGLTSMGNAMGANQPAVNHASQQAEMMNRQPNVLYNQAQQMRNPAAGQTSMHRMVNPSNLESIQQQQRMSQMGAQLGPQGQGGQSMQGQGLNSICQQIAFKNQPNQGGAPKTSVLSPMMASPNSSAHIQKHGMASPADSSFQGPVNVGNSSINISGYQQPQINASLNVAAPSPNSLSINSPHMITSSQGPPSVDNNLPQQSQPPPTYPTQQQQVQQQPPQQQQTLDSQQYEKFRQSIVKFSNTVAKHLATLEKNPTMWTEQVQKAFLAGKSVAEVNKLSHAQLEAYNREIKNFYTTHAKMKSGVSDKLIRAINDILPMPALNYDLHKVFDEPKRIAKGSLITCPAKRSKTTDLESCVGVSGESDSVPQERRHQELKIQLQKEIAINSECFDIRFADNSSYHSDPIVFNCSLKHVKTSQALSSKHPSFFLRVEVSTDYPDEVIECSIQPVDSTRALIGESNSATSMKDVEDNKDGGKTSITSLTERRAVLSKRFNSSLNLTSNCSFSQALNKFYTFYHNSILVS